MKDFLNLCKLRRSVRAFRQEAVPQEKLEYIMECVRLAPSAVNRQPWHFKCLTEKAGLARLAECYNRPWFAGAPACIVAYRDKEQEWVRSCDGKPHGDIDVAIAVEHLCLAAAELGLGSCWVCNFEVEVLKRLLPAPAGWEPVALVPIGFPSDEAPDEKKRKDIKEILA